MYLVRVQFATVIQLFQSSQSPLGTVQAANVIIICEIDLFADELPLRLFFLNVGKIGIL